MPDDSISNYQLDQFTDGPINTIIVYFRRSRFKYYNYWKAFLLGWKHIRSHNKIDLVHMNVIYPHVWQAIYLKWKHKIPFIVSEHWHGFQNFKNHKISNLSYRLIKLGFKCAYSISPVSNNLKQSMINSGFKADYKVIPNVVDTSLFHMKKKTMDSFTFLHVSTLDDEIKNVSGIIEAFSNLELTNVNLKVIGDGPNEWIVDKVNEFNLSDKVEIIGTLSHKEIASAMQDANVFVLFSNIENLPLVLLESMATGLPIITTKVGGISEIFDDNKGVMVEPKDIKELEEAMNYIYMSYSKYDSATISKYANDNFSYEKIGNEFDKLYKKAINTVN